MFPKLNIRRKGSLASSAVIRAPRNQALRRCLPLSAAVVLSDLSHLVTYCHDCLRKWNGARGGRRRRGGGVLFRRGLEMDGRRSSPASLEGNPGGERVGERVVDGNKCVVAAYVCWLVGTFLPCAGPAVSGGHCYRDRLNIRQPPHLYGCSGPRITLPGFKAREKQWSYPHPPHFPLPPPLPQQDCCTTKGHRAPPRSRRSAGILLPCCSFPAGGARSRSNVLVAGPKREGKQYLGRGKCCPFATMTGADQAHRFPR